jgi:hypothetical protein
MMHESQHGKKIKAKSRNITTIRNWKNQKYLLFDKVVAFTALLNYYKK